MAEIFQSFGVTATSAHAADGSLVPAHAFTGSGGFVIITSANGDYIVTLPDIADVDLGAKCKFWIGANGCEVRTPASSGTEINDVDSDGTNEAAIPATHYFEVIKVETDNWQLNSWTSGGAAATVTPDTA